MHGGVPQGIQPLQLHRHCPSCLTPHLSGERQAWVAQRRAAIRHACADGHLVLLVVHVQVAEEGLQGEPEVGGTSSGQPRQRRDQGRDEVQRPARVPPLDGRPDREEVSMELRDKRSVPHLPHPLEVGLKCLHPTAPSATAVAEPVAELAPSAAIGPSPSRESTCFSASDDTSRHCPGSSNPLAPHLYQNVPVRFTKLTFGSDS